MPNPFESGNVLSADSLSKAMVRCLPKDASPQLKSAYDAVALAGHAAMLAVGFRLTGLGEDHTIDTQPDSSTTQSLPPEWNASPSSIAFCYAHSQSSMEFLLKTHRMGNKIVIMGIAVGDDKTTSFDIRPADYISDSNLPATPSKPDTSAEEAVSSLIGVFISNGRLVDFGALMRLHIIQKLIPSLQKEGYEESKQSSSTTSTTDQRQPAPHPRHPLREDYQPPAHPYPLHDPLARPRNPFPTSDFPPPDFEDPYDMNRPPRLPGGLPGFGNIGERDLYPRGLGPNDPLRGGFGPGFAGGFGSGGMHPTLGDFDGGRGGPGYDLQAPPGSRYDPIGPGGAPRGSGGARFPGGSQPPNSFSGFGGGGFL